MAPDNDLVANASPAPFESTTEDCPSIHADVGNFRQDTRLGWDHEVSCASAYQQDRRVGSRKRCTMVVVDGSNAAVETRGGKLVGS